MRSSFVLLVIVSSVLVAEPVKDDTKKIYESLQGEWTVTSAEMDGKALPNVKDFSLTFTKDKLSIAGPKKDEQTFKLDTNRKPMEIDCFEGEQLAGRGIFEIDGDVLKLCLGGVKHEFSNADPKAGKRTVDERPTKFDSKLGALILLKRAEKK